MPTSTISSFNKLALLLSLLEYFRNNLEHCTNTMPHADTLCYMFSSHSTLLRIYISLNSHVSSPSSFVSLSFFSRDQLVSSLHLESTFAPQCSTFCNGSSSFDNQSLSPNNYSSAYILQNVSWTHNASF